MTVPANMKSAPRGETTTRPPGAVLTCAACGGENQTDARFCRHCGHALHAADANGAEAGSATHRSATANGAAPARDTDTTRTPGRQGPASEIDRRRARQLLDRALVLSERGDNHNAILSCRQAIALMPQSAQGYSMLGLLLERAGDVPNAIKAYETVVALSPDSLLERDSLQRLRATRLRNPAGNAKAISFNFDEAELFGDLSHEQTLDKTVEAVRPAGVESVQPTKVQSTKAHQTSHALGIDTFTPAAVLKPAATRPAATPAVAASAAAAGVTPGAAPVRTIMPSASRPAPPTSDSASLLTGDLLEEAPSGGAMSGWRNLLNHPSFYYRGLPLVAAALMSLLFLAWAQRLALSRQEAALSSQGGTTTAVLESGTGGNQYGTAGGGQDDNAQAVQGTSRNAYGNSGNRREGDGATTRGTRQDNAGDQFNIQNRPGQGPRISANTANNRPGNAAGNQNRGGSPGAGSAPARSGTTNSRSPASGPPPRRGEAQSAPAARPLPSFPVPRPAPARPAPPPSGGRSTAPDNVDGFSLPPARVPPPSARIPIDNGGSSGGPVRPVTGGGRNTIRIVPDRPSPVTAPVRPSARAEQAERAASREARTGNSRRAIERIDDSLRTGRAGTTGYAYQQRGLLQLERGEYSRAMDSFRTAISAYQDQISRGQNTSEARAGIRACQSGLRLAQSQQ